MHVTALLLSGTVIFQVLSGMATFIIIRLALNVALTHQNWSYRDSETKENVEA